MNCLAIDDEPLALNIIEDYAEKVPYLNLVGKCTNAFEALNLMQQHKIDLIFLDIEMPHLSGIDFLQSIEKRPYIIFTTAYPDYAVQGFELNAADYLLKPIEFNRFLKAVNKVYGLYNLQREDTVNVAAAPHHEIHSTTPDYLLIKVEYATVKVEFNSILYIEGLKDYVKINTGGKPLLTKSTMKNIEEKLPSNMFTRVHKSFVVNLARIESIENNRILINDRRIPIGSQYKNSFFDLVDRFRL